MDILAFSCVSCNWGLLAMPMDVAELHSLSLSQNQEGNYGDNMCTREHLSAFHARYSGITCL